MTGFGSRAAMQVIVYVRDKYSATDLQTMQDGSLAVLCLDVDLAALRHYKLMICSCATQDKPSANKRACAGASVVGDHLEVVMPLD